jgi:hypothetical protein
MRQPALIVLGIASAFFLGRLSLAAGMDAEHLGWLAASLTLLTFSMRSMRALRVTAIAANLCFIGYAALMALTPILVLHLLLLPLNALRLLELGSAGRSSAAADRERTAAARPAPQPRDRPNSGRSRMPTMLPRNAAASHTQPCRLPEAMPEKKAPMLQPKASLAP